MVSTKMSLKFCFLIFTIPCLVLAQTNTPVEFPTVDAKPAKKQRRVQIRKEDATQTPRTSPASGDPIMTEMPGTPHPGPAPSTPVISTAPLPPVMEEPGKDLGISQKARALHSWYAGLESSIFDLVIPNKLGVVAGWQKAMGHAYEFEYLKGSVGLPGPLEKFGNVTEDRFTWIRRSYFHTNSFNLFYGLHFNRFESHVGGAILNRVTGGQSVDLLALESWGSTIGIGNRWVAGERVSLGIDWITYSQPLIVTRSQSDLFNAANDSSDSNDLKSGFNYVKNFPRISIFKVQLGFLF